MLTTPILYDFYNYPRDEPQYGLLLNEFLQVCIKSLLCVSLHYLFVCHVKTMNFGFAIFLQNTALCGALLFFIGMKNSILKRQLKKKTPKTKTV